MLASFASDIVAFLWFVMTSIFLSLPASQVYFASQRQKKNGMSWSTAGSQALSALACVVLNDRTRKWLNEANFTLTLNQTA